MKLKLMSVLVAGLLSAAPSFATTVTLDFEGASSFGSINNFYNGGTDIPANNTTAATSGVNYGASFGGDALAISNDEFSTYYSNAPTNGTIMTAVGSDAALNFASGFTGPISFSYSSNAATQVQVFSGLNGTGSVLGTFSLLNNAQSNCTDTAFCHWDIASLNIDGVAQSIQFGTSYSADISSAGFDNVTVNAVPLPAAGWAMFSAISGLGALVRRKRAA